MKSRNYKTVDVPLEETAPIDHLNSEQRKKSQRNEQREQFNPYLKEKT